VEADQPTFIWLDEIGNTEIFVGIEGEVVSVGVLVGAGGVEVAEGDGGALVEPGGFDDGKEL